LVGHGVQGFWRLDPGQYVGVELGDLTSITDQSGNGYAAAQASSILRPTLDPAGNSFQRPSAFFTGASYLSIASAFAASMPANNWSIWFVGVIADELDTSQGMMSVGATAGYSFDAEGSAYALRSIGVGVASDGADEFVVHTFQIDRVSNVLHMYIDGTEVALSSSNVGVSAPSGASSIGAFAATFFYIGWMLEGGGKTPANSSAQRSILATYARTRYGF
jgi:hypothetical protein